MKFLDDLFDENTSTNTVNNNKMISTSTTTTATAATKFPKELLTTTTTQVNSEMTKHNEHYYNALIQILSEIQSWKTWFIIMAIGLLTIISIKIAIMCKKVYKIHNDKIILKHNRISPQI